MAKTSIDTLYEVGTGNGLLTFELNVGFGQPQLTTIRLNRKNIKETTDSPVTLDLGTARDLIGQTLSVITTVKDFNPDTDKSSVAYLLTGGMRDQRWYLENDMATSGGIIIYTFRIEFI